MLVPMKSTHRPDGSEQLALLQLPAPTPQVPAQFRLSEQTRQLGLRKVAQIRRQLQEQAARQRATTLPARPPVISHQHRDAA
jgi:hypothetical protein